MAAVNTPPDDAALQQNNWGPQDDQVMGTPTHGNGQSANGASMPSDEHNPSQETENSNGDFPPPRGSSVGAASTNGAKADNYRGEKQVKVPISLAFLHLSAL
ncbi:hypothetical protein NMY22_g3970 [Coprinellus aureogranulatus]|nr:hypothetical protein NMY22_g3970 [Coprinellus aureogranulatus]